MGTGPFVLFGGVLGREWEESVEVPTLSVPAM